MLKKLYLTHREGKKLFTACWKGMKTALGWNYKWKTNIVHTLISIYIVPYADSKTLKCNDLIQNLEYFEEEDFYFHVHCNPWITEEWRDLWPRLQSAGWEMKEISRSEEENVELAYVFSSISEPVPGIHIFHSKLAMTQFIGR